MTEQGQFIVFEGPDGSGKTTALAETATALRERGYEVVTTREPGGTPFAEDVRSLVLTPSEGGHQRNSEVDMMMVYAARAQHIQKLIVPALERGAIVLCDRLSMSTWAYQVVMGGASDEKFWMLDEQFVPRQPDMYLHLEADQACRLERLSARSNGATNRFDDVAESIGDALERGYRSFMETAAMREAYQHTAFVGINAEQSPESVCQDCVAAITEGGGR